MDDASSFHIVNLRGQVSGVLRGSGCSEEEETIRLQMWVKSLCGDFFPFLLEGVLLYHKGEHQKQQSWLRAVMFKYLSTLPLLKKYF